MKYADYCKKVGLNPNYFKELALSIIKEMDKGTAGGYISLTYLEEKLRKMNNLLTEFKGSEA